MATKRTIRRAPSKTKYKRSTGSKQPFILLRILPQGVQTFLARRVIDIVALASLAVGGFIALALFSYTPTDPSANSATNAQNISNWMGHNGAIFSDILVQTLGIGAFIFAATFIAWGLRAFNRHSLSPLWMRIPAMLLGAVLCAIAFAQTPSGAWLNQPYIGGALGTITLNKAAANLPWISLAIITSICAFLAFATTAFAMAVTRDELSGIARTIWNGAYKSVLAIAYTAHGFQQWLRHHNNPDYRPNPLAMFKSNTAEDDATDAPKAAKPSKRVTPKITSEAPMTATSSIDARSQDTIPVVTPKTSVGKPATPQKRFNLDEEIEWELPDINMLESPPMEIKDYQLDEAALRRNAELLQNVLMDFNVEGEITSIHPGPVVTLYELEPSPGTKSAKVISLADDIARSMSAISVRVAVVPGRNVIGIELPNKSRQIVYMQELLASKAFEKTSASLPLALGKDIGGQSILADLAKMPHLLVAGTTGSGKSVAVNTMILSLLFALPPEKCRFIMIDPKMLELSVYDGIPHLLAPVVTEPGKAVVALKWTVQEMEERYRAMSKLGVRNVNGYNERVREAARKGETIMHKVQTGFDDVGKAVYEDQPMDLNELPFIVVIVDEFADLMLVAGKDVEGAIQRLAQMARAAGIHLIMATQRPSVDVITGVIKANFPTRISFQVTSKIDSRTILGEGGAEQLLGMGDMLYMAPGGRITRVHGPFVSDEDVEKVVNDLKAQAAPAYIDSITEGDFADASEVMQAIFEDRNNGEKVDELYDEAVAIVARDGKASTSYVQRVLQIGYNRAARIIEEMERQGVISKANATGKRTILVGDYSEVG